MKKYILILSVFFGIGVNAQIAKSTFEYPLIRATSGKEYLLPNIKTDELLREDSIEALKGKRYAPRFAYAHQVNATISNSGEWKILSNGKLWQIRFKTQHNYATGIIFNEFNLPTGGYIYVYNPTSKQKLGPFTNESSFNNKLSVSPLKGGEVVVEYFVPSYAPNNGSLSISQVNEAYKNIFQIVDTEMIKKGFNNSGSCNNNVVCPEADFWRDQVRSVGLIILGGGTRWCSGCMVGNTDTTLTPYFLTAYHCVDKNDNSEIIPEERDDVALWNFVFDYESRTCTPNQDSAFVQSISGGTLRAAYFDTDVALIELSAQPPANYNIFYAGWDRVSTPANNAFGIHHPSGDVKKISFEDDNIIVSPVDANRWRVNAWDDGVTEPGSSGSALFNEQGRIVGQLYGGLASCNNQANSNPNDDFDEYGRFDVSWNAGATDEEKLAPWLDASNSNSSSINGYYFPLSASNNKTFTDEFSLYPVPTSDGRLFVSLNINSTDEFANIQFYDAVGKLIFQSRIPTKVTRYSININDFPNGVYLVKVVSDTFSETKQISISR
jgi:lysyl endopeptidase